MRSFACDVGFVGNSGVQIIEKCLKKIGNEKVFEPLLNKVALQYCNSKHRCLRDISLKLNAEEQKLYEWALKNIGDVFEPAVTWKATQVYRLRCVKKLLPFKPHIHGDVGWHNFLNGDAALFPELNYYSELPLFYNICKINFNTTSLQMKNGLNQRVFDVPACASFLLTDYKEQMENMFDIGKEVVCYTEPDEVPELISFYLRHDQERLKIIERAHKRVLNEHTYEHRLTKMLLCMRKNYA